MIFRPIAYSEHLLSQYEICSFSIRFTALPKFFPCYDVTSREFWEYNFAFICSKYPTLGARSMKTKTPLDMLFFALKQIFHGGQLYWNSLKSHVCCHKYFKGWKSLKNLKVGVFESDFKQVPFVLQQTTHTYSESWGPVENFG